MNSRLDTRWLRLIFFIIDLVTSYNTLLSEEWIYVSRCFPLTLYQYLIIWHEDGSIEVVKANAKPFIITFNVTDALLYIKNIGLVIFLGHDNESRQTNYVMT